MNSRVARARSPTRRGCRRNTIGFPSAPLADAVAVGVEVAGLVEEPVRLVGVVRVLLVLRDVGDPRGVRRTTDRHAGLAEPDAHPIEERLLVDRVGDGVADRDVLQRRMAVADAVPRMPFIRSPRSR